MMKDHFNFKRLLTLLVLSGCLFIGNASIAQSPEPQTKSIFSGTEMEIEIYEEEMLKQHQQVMEEQLEKECQKYLDEIRAKYKKPSNEGFECKSATAQGANKSDSEKKFAVEKEIYEEEMMKEHQQEMEEQMEKKRQKHMEEIRAKYNKSLYEEFELKSATATITVNESDSLNLVALYNATDGPNWTNNTNWLSGPVRTWYGIYVENDRVTGIYLDNNNLTDSLPSELGELSDLKYLHLGRNQITGSIPVKLGQLSKLIDLYLNSNPLTGSIPAELGQLPNLQILNLNANQLTGGIPPELGQLSSLHSLYIGPSKISGEIPAELGHLSNLDILWLDSNDLSGSLPDELGQLSNLRFMYLGSNELTGNIPPELGQLSNLIRLSIWNNRLTGIIPKEIGGLSNLISLALSSNQITGSIPNEFGQLSNLEKLLLNDNYLQGIVPIEILQIETLTDLQIQNNLFDVLPEFTKPDSLNTFYLNNNNFSFEDFEDNMDAFQHISDVTYHPQKKIGQPDTILLQLGDNYTLNISCGGTQNSYQWFKNGISLGTPSSSSKWQIENAYYYSDAGTYTCLVTNNLVPDLTIESEPILIELPEPPFNTQDSLALVALYNATDGPNWTKNTNWLSGPMSNWYGITTENKRVVYIFLGNNNLRGSLPPELGQLSNLQQLFIYSNPLTGSIPPELGQLSNLQWLFLMSNKLTGSIPPELGQLSNLQQLWLGVNQLTGNIPAELGQLSNLQQLWLGVNQLTGSIPPGLGQLSSLQRLWLIYNQLSGNIPPELGQLSNLTHLELELNQLAGSLPSELGQLSNLQNLYLHNNMLSGKIPVELSQLTNLEQLFVNNNFFEGTFPVEIFQINKLADLRIQNNLFDVLPNFIKPDSLNTFYLNNNAFTFEDFEDNMDALHGISKVTYYPQNKIGLGDTVILQLGDNYKLDISCGGTRNSYQWYKDSVLLPLQTSDTLKIEKVEFSDLGSYYCKVTNSLVPDLTLYSNQVTIKIKIINCLTNNFKQGWNIFSTPVQPEQAEMLTIFQPMINNNSLVKIQDEGGNSVEDWGIYGSWQNYIGNISPTEGYKVKVSKNDSLEVCGAPVKYPFAIPLESGWNIIGFPHTTAVDGLDVVTQLTDKRSLVKAQDEEGNSIEDWGIYGSWQNNIGDFVPGKGYTLKVSADDTLWINENYPKSSAILPEVIATNHFKPAFEGNGLDHMNINLVGLPVNILQSGDELAIFDGITCVGAITLMPHHLQSQTASIAVNAKDNQGMPGFTEGNPITLKLWNSKQNSEYILEPEIVKGTNTFAKYETTFASLEKYTATGLEGKAGFELTEINCYPNPFSEEVTIEIKLAKDSEVQVEVLNQMGQRVKFVHAKQPFNSGLHKLNWNVRNSSNQAVSPGIYHIKVNIDDTYVYKKVIFSK